MKVTIDMPNDFTRDYTADKFKDFFSRVIADIDCKGMCGKYEKEIAEMFLKAFDNSKEKNTCNCQHNSNSRDNEPCCRCDSRKENREMKIVTVSDLIKILDTEENRYGGATGKPRMLNLSLNGNFAGSVEAVKLDGYGDGLITDVTMEITSSKFTTTNADRIRNMSDEEMASVLFSGCIDSMDLEKCPYASESELDNNKIRKICKKCVLEWLQSEAE
jgi:hypothetical protein